MYKLNPSIKHHLLLGLLISLWVFIFAFVIRPFDDGTLNVRLWFLMGLGFSLIAFLSYAVLVFLQNRIYKKVPKWSIYREIGSHFFFYFLYLFCAFGYYKSPIMNGGYTFYEFSTIIFLKVVVILTPIVLLARRYVIKLIPSKEESITIKGENKLDILKMKQSDLVCISNSQNYVEIFFISNDQLKTKLIRTSLKKLQTDFDFLVQIHRSHLINPSHFKSWKNQNWIVLTHIELPVSKNYKENLLSL